MINIKGKCELQAMIPWMVPDDHIEVVLSGMFSGRHKNEVYIRTGSVPPGVIPKVYKATALDMQPRCSAIGFAPTDEAARKAAKRNLRKKVMERTKKEKVVITLGPDGYYIRDLNGFLGSGPDLQSAIDSLHHIERVVTSLFPETVEDPKPEPVKKWSIWDWFRK